MLWAVGLNVPSVVWRTMAKELPRISEELMAQVDRIFAHGPSRAKNHDQRFGQWLVNKIRTKDNKKYAHIDDLNIQGVIFNMENQEFLDYMEDYND